MATEREQIDLTQLAIGTEVTMSDGSPAYVSRQGHYTYLTFPEGTTLRGWPRGDERFYEADGTVVAPAEPCPYVVAIGDVPVDRPAPEPERLPFDPMQPIELDDGTSCRILSATLDSAAWCWVVQLLDVSPGMGMCSYNYSRTGGFSNGTPEGSCDYPRLQNVDLTASPALKKARREFARLDDSERPDWLEEDWFAPYRDLHFPQLVDQDEIAMVSFYENERKLEADRRTVMRVGRYVRRFSGGKLKDEDVERVAAASDVKLRGNRVKFTQDADEIETIYLKGPRSCMAYGVSSYDTGGIHPTRVYAGPDLAIAYLGETDDASARCVVWPERKLYGTVYGDVSRMSRMLENMGYESGSMDGARVRLIECDHGIVMPYVDDAGAGRIDRSEGVVVLGDGYDVDTGSTNGLGEDSSRVCCERCDDRVDEDSTTSVLVSRYGYESWCDYCAGEYGTWCEGSHETVPTNMAVAVNGGTEFVPEWTINNGDYVEVTAGEQAGELWHVDLTAGRGGETYHIDDLPDGETVEALPPLAPHAELEAAGQMRLPLPIRGEFRLMGRDHRGEWECNIDLRPAMVGQNRFRGTVTECEAARAELARLYPNIAYTVEPAPTLDDQYNITVYPAPALAA